MIERKEYLKQLISFKEKEWDEFFNESTNN